MSDKVYCKNCKYYESSSRLCYFKRRNEFNSETEYRGKLSDNDGGECENYVKKYSFWKNIFHPKYGRS